MKHSEEKRPVHVVWRNVILMTLLHAVSVYAVTQLHKAHLATIVWEFFYYVMAALGVTAGAHRLWSHKSYKARLPLKIFLAVLNSMALQNSIFDWARDHRVHHKFSETDADPHNAKRGFFFSHIGWLLVRKHPDVIEKGKRLDLNDLYNDPVVMLQHRYYIPSVILMCFVLPAAMPLLWGETLSISYLTCLLRYCAGLNVTWCVNSVAHMWGNKPYDKSINPAENLLVVICAMGEGFHNYHHVFPHDYATSEFGFRFNLTTAFIDCMFYLGLAYDLRTVAPETILARKKRTGYLSD
ncbi:stearoyl-CoA desaturase 5-like isoform X1 [Clavelina lepadiformis]|uniref:stearoyl-CoA desaturase 5-like isoform X1 n=1 Tax=Clavelina lepadiformis TaxID=159417 RepID=UPI004041A450